MPPKTTPDDTEAERLIDAGLSGELEEDDFEGFDPAELEETPPF